MPAKNRIKIYSENSFYHIYNRGIDKKPIFLDNQDYSVFLNYLTEYLEPKDTDNILKELSNPLLSYKDREKLIRLLRLNNFSDEIIMYSYCLMPNHFHFLVKQKSVDSIDKFMNSLGTRYTGYFNKKYNRVGTLYQGVYKAVLVMFEEQYLYLSAYIHKQALLNQPSSFNEYVGKRKYYWVNIEEISSNFSKTNSNLTYESFVGKTDNFDQISPLILE